MRYKRESNLLAVGTAAAIALVVGGLAVVWALIYDIVSKAPVVQKAADQCATVCCVPDKLK
jgi:hypothetical protein